ncbi:hypothetical protein EVAR_66600_1 [Eumeta japonica]|uniref:Uncharacterized protein n=1 Tax=Eumeta variegata TaxID=151549 RepID=A0A4C1SI16_EUMVA|nr:hypothetical protein EVAR_66600_1 [Eumeta japonica]
MIHDSVQKLRKLKYSTAKLVMRLGRHRLLAYLGLCYPHTFSLYSLGKRVTVLKLSLRNPSLHNLRVTAGRLALNNGFTKSAGKMRNIPYFRIYDDNIKNPPSARGVGLVLMTIELWRLIDQGSTDDCWVFNLSQMKTLASSFGQHVKPSVPDAVVVLMTAVVNSPRHALGQHGWLSRLTGRPTRRLTTWHSRTTDFTFRGTFLVGFSPTIPTHTGVRVCGIANETMTEINSKEEVEQIFQTHPLANGGLPEVYSLRLYFKWAKEACTQFSHARYAGSERTAKKNLHALSFHRFLPSRDFLEDSYRFSPTATADYRLYNNKINSEKSSLSIFNCSQRRTLRLPGRERHQRVLSDAKERFVSMVALDRLLPCGGLTQVPSSQKSYVLRKPNLRHTPKM